jgi:CO/xanthine dehydrogenase FAD-binding subunit
MTTAVLRPADWAEALALRADHPDALPIAGGTDVMVAIARAGARPPALLDLSRVPDLRGWRLAADHVYVRAGVTYTELAERQADRLPGIASVAGQIGSRQVRNRGTVGGALGLAAPAGDLHPMLLALDAEIELSSRRGSRWVPAHRFYLGPGRTALAADELIAAVRLPRTAGSQRFLRIGRRRGMVKTICSVALVLDVRGRRVGVGVGGVGPVPRRPVAAEEFLAAELDWRADALPDGLVDRFARLVVADSEPASDTHATAAYRRHAAAVLAGRCLRAAWRTHGDEGTEEGTWVSG